MDNIKKLTIIVIRIQAVCFVFMASIQLAIIVGMLLVATFRETPARLENFEYMLLMGGLYFVIGLIIYATSRPLAKFLVASVDDDRQSSDSD